MKLPESVSSGTTQVVPLRREFSKALIRLADLLVSFPRTSEDLVFHDHHFTPTASTRSHSSCLERTRVRDDLLSGKWRASLIEDREQGRPVLAIREQVNPYSRHLFEVRVAAKVRNVIPRFFASPC